MRSPKERVQIERREDILKLSRQYKMNLQTRERKKEAKHVGGKPRVLFQEN